MRCNLPLFLLLAIILAAHPTGAADRIGVRFLATRTSERPDGIRTTVWYPAKSDGKPVSVGDNAVFHGTKGRRGATVADGAFPVVLLSLGGLRAAADLGGWLASRLAGQGFVVAAVQPPRLAEGNPKAALSEYWKRAGDLSAGLTALERASEFHGHILRSEVGAVGFFLGATAVLSLVGGRLDARSVARSCDAGEAGIDCTWFAANGVDLGAIDASRLEASHHDRRVRAAVVIDPELSGRFHADSLAQVDVPVDVINLGRNNTIPSGFDASSLATAGPAFRYRALAGATRFSAFSLCKPEGAKILANGDGESAICRNGAGQDRRAVHDGLAKRIAALLRSHLHRSP